ncbi:metallophosphoesterase [Deinococcus peraridilitoris]|uniref:Putative phosphohydrolase n=1 Tax=Deinococcus peraridilitoris (strain DSM 19664 / LMG 22246 / CIP 109416 / KR-200) TaxID=937777 RepID=L0A4T9_DEIPD|nr:metallophosphoesterase [Deinococcus peraridilitoris]AFZ68030.1 putative phosphohydrolase [Deinococcus peraridilitoris DSM 19664]
MIRRLLQTLLAVTGLFLVHSAWNVYHFRVTRHRRRLSRLRAPLRLVHLSDLHYGRFIRHRSVRAWVDATLHAKPDLIVITGDFLDTEAGDSRRRDLLRELSRLRAPLGVYAVWGNHDWTSTTAALPRDAHRPAGEVGTSRMDDFARELARAGLQVLANEGVQLRPDLYLAGVNDLWFGTPDLTKALAGRQEGSVILLSHNPDLLPEVPGEVGLTLCGHTHGGQIVVPLYGPLHTGSAYGQQFVGGWVQQPRQAYVSRGLGVTFLPLRFLCPAELVVLDLDPG